MKVIHLREHPEYLQEAIAYFQSKWASPASMKVYEDSLTHSFADTDLPQWFLLVDNQAAAVPSIIGCGGLITNDFISRMDLMPWLCALYVDPHYRRQGGARLLIETIKQSAATAGFSTLYLCTDLVSFYEKFGFDGYRLSSLGRRIDDLSLSPTEIDKKTALNTNVQSCFLFTVLLLVEYPISTKGIFRHPASGRWIAPCTSVINLVSQS